MIKNNIPYFIYAPAYTHISSGVRVLHLLCHYLNESGQKAFICPDNLDGYATNPNLNTPLIKQEIINYCNITGTEPIAIYPEKVTGNPFNSKRVVRYLLAEAGKYGGPTIFPETDKVYGYTKYVADKYGTDKTLFLPCYDTSIFYPPKKDEERTIESCFYSHKYDRIHSNTLPDIVNDSVRLMGTPEQLADILRQSKVCYVLEMSEIIVNAELCGCRVILVHSNYFNDLTDRAEFPDRSEEWNNSDVAKEGGRVRIDVWELQKAFNYQLYQFIEDTQEWKI